MNQETTRRAGYGIWIIGVCAMLLTACNDQEAAMAEAKQKPDNSLMRVITGEVWYRERIALPPGAKVIVTLEDQSRADAAATVLTDYTHIVDGAPPYSFRLVYNPSAIDDRMTYGLRARIENDGKLLFTSTEHIDPFASEPGEPVRIMVAKQGQN
ncbi:MAG: YbaY family lipoprotein [Woeseiaceae bacterium]